MDEIREGKVDYQFVEIMACPGGCVMGGGQPIKSSKIRSEVDVRKLRANALYTIDEKSVIRKSHESPVMKQMYAEFLQKPGSEVAHKYLHTHYTAKICMIFNRIGGILGTVLKSLLFPDISDGVEIDIDSWPMIPTYVEIEGKNEMSTLEILELPKDNVTTLDVDSVYKKYEMDLKDIKV